MEDVGRGWKFAHLPAASPGDLYRFALPDGTTTPDPASRFQPQDVHGPSMIVDHDSYCWRCVDWVGRPWNETILYELHIGSFTPQGTFRSAAARLPHLKSLGVTAIEIMPVADFAGARNWGYDGAFPFAPDSTYGAPDDFKFFVDEAHRFGMSVILDVVYNHFGPDGAYMGLYASNFFSPAQQTPWGAGINFDGQCSLHVRRFYLENALYWLEAYRLDGLRFDAIHAIPDASRRHILHEIAREIRTRIARTHIHLIIENEENESRFLDGSERLTAQWNDDVHHVLHVAATDERSGYYADYIHDTDMLGRALTEGFAFQGQHMPYRNKARGTKSRHLAPTRFVSFIQNHDQIGNRAKGERLNSLCAPERLKAIAAIYLLLPQIPMLFMGEEWGASSPFQFFCGFEGELAEAVRTGRRAEFARFPEYAKAPPEAIPDPTEPATFERSKLDWNEIDSEPHADWLALYRSLISLRSRRVVPLLPTLLHGGTYSILGHLAVEAEWTDEAGPVLLLQANLGSVVTAFQPRVGFQQIYPGQNIEVERLAPFSVAWSIVSSTDA